MHAQTYDEWLSLPAGREPLDENEVQEQIEIWAQDEFRLVGPDFKCWLAEEFEPSTPNHIPTLIQKSVGDWLNRQIAMGMAQYVRDSFYEWATNSEYVRDKIVHRMRRGQRGPR